MTRKEKRIFNLAIATWGVFDQLQQTLEETAELQVEIHKIRRNRHTSDRALAGEVADVSIMLDQIKIIYGSEFTQAVKEIRDSKVERLEGRIKKARA